MLRSPDLEVRSTAGVSSPSPGRLVGLAAVFGAPANLGEFTETVRPGAFTRALAERGESILALYDHERRSVLGRTGSGTLRLREDAQGLAFDLDLPDTTLGRDLAVLVKRGDVSGCSFAFRVHDGGDVWDFRDGVMHRELLSVDLSEITITPQPAYADTSVAVRSMPPMPMFRDWVKLGARRAWLETVR
ncbi:MAG: HK97 family phage prohead protease [Xanthomonadales bacterium]|nr:HK97 family phage prohead protease [Xanthomonadales bacterium]